MDAAARRPSAIVSGSATGIGAATAEALARHGIDVTVNYHRSAGAAEATAARCRQRGAHAIAVQGDVSDDAACRTLVERSVAEWGGVDVLVNNAGVTRFVDARDLEALDSDDFDRIMAVNVAGPYLLTRAAAPYLRKSEIASVINISSHSGISGLGSSTAYCASKGGLNTLTLALARALAPEIRVNAVCPGFVDTNWMSAKLGDEDLAAFKEKVAKLAPLRRLVSAHEVAESVCWFALGGRSITGQLLVIDGGTHLTVGSPL